MLKFPFINQGGTDIKILRNFQPGTNQKQPTITKLGYNIAEFTFSE